MATNWTVLTGANIAKVLDWKAVNQANQNLGEDAQSNPTEAGKGVDLAAANRRDEIVAIAVKDVRGAIQSGGRLPLSITLGAVPPSAERHALNLAAWQLIMSTPSLTAAYMGESGLRPVWERLHQDALEYLKGLRSGQSVERPTDPTGVDYLTAPSDTNAEIRGVVWGDMHGTDIQYEAGGYTTDSGTTVTLPADDMKTF